MEGLVSPTPQPASFTADFSALYERCLASGHEARLVFRHAADLQVVTVACSLPTTTTIAATVNKRRRCHRRSQWSRRAATTVGASMDRSPSTAVAAPIDSGYFR